ncbi:hypothetical protein BDK51DRAFT_43812 [Blyttiomyces helicus]|uniref:Uncharacterized protein n=1 Tax=Blyttiomyces helicus TaxID=388810 RepID=A0A4P9WAF4_9FUNG|nr:hypothetical protein BDK51DRAFT_43812 [Blyttiomyces helicus]|eukprot:RKO89192.1 hypothetical protein BDK51DRAFT_43812 [Blyttiomyces helicus]
MIDDEGWGGARKNKDENLSSARVFCISIKLPTPLTTSPAAAPRSVARSTAKRTTPKHLYGVQKGKPGKSMIKSRQRLGASRVAPTVRMGSTKKRRAAGSPRHGKGAVGKAGAILSPAHQTFFSTLGPRLPPTTTRQRRAPVERTGEGAKQPARVGEGTDGENPKQGEDCGDGDQACGEWREGLGLRPATQPPRTSAQVFEIPPAPAAVRLRSAQISACGCFDFQSMRMHTMGNVRVACARVLSDPLLGCIAPRRKVRVATFHSFPSLTATAVLLSAPCCKVAPISSIQMPLRQNPATPYPQPFLSPCAVSTLNSTRGIRRSKEARRIGELNRMIVHDDDESRRKHKEALGAGRTLWGAPSNTDFGTLRLAPEECHCELKSDRAILEPP